jgi:hypothetical protein
LYDPLESVAAIATDKDDREGSSGDKQEEAKKQAKVVLASMKPKGGAKVRTSYFLCFLFFFFFNSNILIAQSESLDQGFPAPCRTYGRFGWQNQNRGSFAQRKRFILFYFIFIKILIVN